MAELNGAKSYRRTYILKDCDCENVKETWDDEEIQPITSNENQIDKVLKKRTNADGKTEILVKWLGCPDKFNS